MKRFGIFPARENEAHETEKVSVQPPASDTGTGKDAENML